MELNAETAVKRLDELQNRLYAYYFAQNAIYLDSVTAAPRDTSEGRSHALGVLSEEEYKPFVNDEVGALLGYVLSDPAAFSVKTFREAEELKDRYDEMTKIPMDEYVEYQMLVSEAENRWHTAKETNDFELFRPYLEKIVSANRRFAAYYDSSKAPYDVLLDKYEKGASMEYLDGFFGRLRERLVPVIKSLPDRIQPDDAFLFRHYPADRQRLLSDYLMDVMGLDRSHCGIAETEHPFTLNFNHSDVRITTHYLEDNLASSLYSVVHEGGHALYELGVDGEFDYTALAGGSSMGLHESQSRFYENIIGRSDEFAALIFPKLLELFPEQLSGVDARQFCRAVNRAQPSLIRTEADELTYPLHIMVRYELEKRLIAGELEVAELPAEWNRLYREYLGVEVPDDTHGVLQDSHWAGGAIGYFPSIRSRKRLRRPDAQADAAGLRRLWRGALRRAFPRDRMAARAHPSFRMLQKAERASPRGDRRVRSRYLLRLSHRQDR